MDRFILKKCACSVALSSAVLSAQVAASKRHIAEPQTVTLKSPTAMNLLRQTALLYARPGLMHIEAVEKSHQANGEKQIVQPDILRSFEQSTGNRWRVETHAPQGAWIEVSDGKTDLKYWIEAKAYELHPAGLVPTHYRTYFGHSEELMKAINVAVDLESMVTQVRKAQRLPDETIDVSGQAYPCYVVQVKNSASDLQTLFVDTIWIDKESHLIRQTIEDTQSNSMDGKVPVPFHETKTTMYPVMELNARVLDSAFSFTPPQGTKQLETLEPQSPRQKPGETPGKTASVMQSEQAPNVPLFDKDGKVVTLATYRGNIVLVDLWATWCGPCLASMSGFAALVKSFEGTGLQVISVDEDVKPEATLRYMEIHGYNWTNLHDRRNGLQDALGVAGIPMTVLLDRSGKVLFLDSVEEDGMGYESKLRTAVAKALAARPEMSGVDLGRPLPLVP